MCEIDFFNRLNLLVNTEMLTNFVLYIYIEEIWTNLIQEKFNRDLKNLFFKNLCILILINKYK